MLANLRFLLALLRTNMRASMALRGAFLVRVGFMAANNLIYFVMWWVFFTKYERVRGWALADMAALFAVCAGAFGLAVVLGGGVRDIARRIVDGDLDTCLTQPKSPLVQTTASRSEPSGWGDMASGLALLALSGYATPAAVPLWLVSSVFGALVFLATGVIFQSLAFWMGDTSTFSRQAWEFIIMFSLYPRTLFGGWLKLLLFTAVPAGFVSFLPVELVRDFRVTTLLAVVGGALLYSALAALVFAAGLRRYESGNRFGLRI
jgi:ABC-2 type transport system permease protein